MCKVQRYLCMLGHFSHVWLFATPWTVAHQAPLSMGFSRQEYWSGLPCPPPGDLPNPGTKPTSLMPPALAGGFFTTSSTWGVLQKHKDGEIGPEDVLLKVITDTQTHPVIPSEHLAYCAHGITKVLGWGVMILLQSSDPDRALSKIKTSRPVLFSSLRLPVPSWLPGGLVHVKSLLFWILLAFGVTFPSRVNFSKEWW